MTDVVRYRGPDDSGDWSDAAAGVGLGHRRLAIVDLSAEGHQPMHSASGRYVMVFNGEVYNFRELALELEQARGIPLPLRGGSDTEIMLAAIEHWGLRAATERFVGMFAFALWDRQERALHLVRDRLGIKPLYYGSADGSLLFGSELASLRQYPGFDRTPDLAAVRGFFRYGYVAAPRSIYQSARKLLPGTIATFKSPRSLPQVDRYWSAESAVARGKSQPFRGSFDEASAMLEQLLGEAVRLRMIADVPFGAFLSGGIDSSVVVALMQRQSMGRVKTFSIGNETAAYDESASAREVAALLGTEHTAFPVTDRQALDVAPRLGAMFDEPFADSSQIPTFLVSQLARSHVTVALSGDGGDELFGGYNRHVWAPRVLAASQRLPPWARALARRALMGVPTERWDRLYGRAAFALPKLRLAGDKVHKLAQVVDSANAQELYVRLCSQWQAPELLLAPSQRATLSPEEWPEAPAGLGFDEQMMFLDLTTYLPDDILTKVDRASMQVSLEARVPLLDHRVVEFAWSLPGNFKIEGGVGKRILRDVLGRHLPAEQLARPKMGFGVPVGAWLRGSLRPWACDLLSPASLAQSGLLAPEPIQAALSEHLSGRHDRTQALWSVLMFVSWWREQTRA